MINLKGVNLWTYDYTEFSRYVLCVTTNGDVNMNGRAVMGRGVALQVRNRIPGIDQVLANRIKEEEGPFTGFLDNTIYSFAVKYHWSQKASLELIKESAIILQDDAEANPEKIFILPRPGCGNGHLIWRDVNEVIKPILGDNIICVTNQR